METLEQGVTMFKVNKRRYSHRSGVFIVNFEQVNADWVRDSY